MREIITRRGRSTVYYCYCYYSYTTAVPPSPVPPSLASRLLHLSTRRIRDACIVKTRKISPLRPVRFQSSDPFHTTLRSLNWESWNSHRPAGSNYLASTFSTSTPGTATPSAQPCIIPSRPFPRLLPLSRISRVGFGGAQLRPSSQDTTIIEEKLSQPSFPYSLATHCLGS